MLISYKRIRLFEIRLIFINFISSYVKIQANKFMYSPEQKQKKESFRGVHYCKQSRHTFLSQNYAM